MENELLTLADKICEEHRYYQKYKTCFAYSVLNGDPTGNKFKTSKTLEDLYQDKISKTFFTINTLISISTMSSIAYGVIDSILNYVVK